MLALSNTILLNMSPADIKLKTLTLHSQPLVNWQELLKRPAKSPCGEALDVPIVNCAEEMLMGALCIDSAAVKATHFTSDCWKQVLVMQKEIFFAGTRDE